MFQDDRGVGKLKTPSIVLKCKMGDTILHFDAMEGQESPLLHQNMRWGVVMHRCPLSHTLMQWRGRDG